MLHNTGLRFRVQLGSKSSAQCYCDTCTRKAELALYTLCRQTEQPCTLVLALWCIALRPLFAGLVNVTRSSVSSFHSKIDFSGQLSVYSIMVLSNGQLDEFFSDIKGSTILYADFLSVEHREGVFVGIVKVSLLTGVQIASI